MVARFHRWLRVVNLREWMLIAAVTSVFAIWLFERVLRLGL